MNSEYEKRVIHIDKLLEKENYAIYLNGEDRSLEHIQVSFVDKNHGSLTFNSFDMNQTQTVLDLIQQSGECLIHSVIRFIREKLSSDMFRLFDLENVKVVWDSHGTVPEDYHALSNIHTEMVTSEIEKIFYNKADVLICRYY